MAVFNPPVADTQDPNYLRYSQTPPGIQADTSGQIVGKTVGNAIEMGVATVDTGIKSDIDSKVYSSVDREREAYLDAGEQALAGGPLSLTANPVGPPPPPGLEKSLGGLERQFESYIAGATPETLYKGRLLSITKAIRNQYPGYRDYIDAKVSQVSGVPQANSYADALYGDINRAANASSSKTDKIETLYRQNLEMGPEVAARLQQYRTDGDVASAEKWISERLYRKYDLNMRQLQRQNFNGTLEELSTLAIRDANVEAGDLVQQYMSSLMNAEGKNLADIAQKARNGEINIDGTQSIAYSQATQAAIDEVSRRLNQKWNRVENGRSLSRDVASQDKLNKVIADAVQPLVTLREAFHKGDVALAATATAMNTAIRAEAERNLYRSPNGHLYANAGALTNINPQLAAPLFEPILRAAVDDATKGMLMKQTTDMLNAADPRANPVSIAAVMKASRNAGVTPMELPKIFEQQVQFIGNIANPKLPVEQKKGLVIAAFSPENRETLSNFKKDYFDPTTRKWTNGKYFAFETLTNDKITKEVAQLGPEYVEMYRNWYRTAFTQDLFSNELSSLNSIMSTHDIGWDSDNKRIMVRTRNTGGATNRGPRVGQAVEVEQRLNRGISRVVAAETAFGNKNVDATVLQLIMDSGNNIITKKIGDAFYLTKKPDAKPVKTPDDVFRNNFSPEDTQGDLNSFLRSPTGASTEPVRRFNGEGVINGNLSDEEILGIERMPTDISGAMKINPLEDPSQMMLEGGGIARGGPRGYKIMDRQTGEQIGKTYNVGSQGHRTVRRRANNRAEKMNLEWGAHRYSLDPIWE